MFRFVHWTVLDWKPEDEAPASRRHFAVRGDLTCPWLGIYPDGDSEEVSKLRDAVISSETASDVVRFDVSSDEAWARALNWFDAHMR